MKGIDIETTGLDHNRDTIIGFGIGDHFYPDGAGATLPETACYHNGKFDLKFLRKFWHNQPPYTFDTMLAASVLINRPESLSLDSLAAHYLGVTSWKSLDRKKMASYPLHEVGQYCIKDVHYTEQLADKLCTMLYSENTMPFFIRQVMPAARMLLDVECRGMRIDVERARKELRNIRIELIGVTRSIWKHFGRPIMLTSPKRVVKAMQALGITPTCYDYKKREIVVSTRDEALQQLTHPVAKLLMKHRELSKLKGYLNGWLSDHFEGRIFPTYNMASTRTGRLSCSNPNLQQVPRDKAIRSLFIPSSGKVFVIGDFAQIEPRVAAHYSGDKALRSVFTSKQDLYGSIAVRVLGATCEANEVKDKFPELRRLAKVIGLSILYGIGAKKLSNFIRLQAGLNISEKQAKTYISDYFNAYPGLRTLRDRVDLEVAEKGYVTNYFGRKVKIDPVRVFSTGVNSLIQSTASDACLFSQLQLASDPKAALIAIVHDEVIYEVDPEYAQEFGRKLEQTMTNQGFDCPLTLDWKVCDNWGEK